MGQSGELVTGRFPSSPLCWFRRTLLKQVSPAQGWPEGPALADGAAQKKCSHQAAPCRLQTVKLDLEFDDSVLLAVVLQKQLTYCTIAIFLPSGNQSTSPTSGFAPWHTVHSRGHASPHCALPVPSAVSPGSGPLLVHLWPKDSRPPGCCTPVLVWVQEPRPAVLSWTSSSAQRPCCLHP